MRDRPESIPSDPSPPIDLSRTTENIRRAIYDAVVAIHFSRPGGDPAAKQAGEWYEQHTADECGVQVAYLLGRWFVVWRIWSVEDSAPESQLWSVLTVNARPGARFGIEFQEV